MARVLCISSNVARGHIGLGATVPALETLGHEVIALPTVMLSNHPGHALFAKHDVAPAFLTKSVAVFQMSGWLKDIDAVLSGYLPTAGHVAAVAKIVRQVRKANPKSIYVCDPVLGDDPGGLYIPAQAASAIRDLLAGLADYITPNRFELQWLSGVSVTSAKGAADAAQVLGRPVTVATSVPTGKRSTIGTMLMAAGSQPRLFPVKHWKSAPHGTGDLLAGLFAGHVLSGQTFENSAGRAAAGVALAVADSQGCDELDLTNSRAHWLDIVPVDSHII